MSSYITIEATQQGLLLQNGGFVEVLPPGRYRVRYESWWQRLTNAPVTKIIPVDVRHQELTIKGQEILTADKVAIRVSVLVQFRVTDPKLAVLSVTSYNDRIYSDVQLAARRSLAGMNLEEILTNRTRLSEEILLEVREDALSYGIEIRRADVKDLIFPGNLQEVMNRVLTAERLSQAELVEARTFAERSRIETESEVERKRIISETEAEAIRLKAEAEAEARLASTRAEVESIRLRESIAVFYKEHPSLLRIQELNALQDLSQIATAHLYIGFDKHAKPTAEANPQESPSQS